MEYVGLIDHIDHRREHGDGEEYHRKKIQKCVYRRVGRLCDDESTVHRKEDREDIDEIYRYTDDKYCKSKRKESTSRTHRKSY